MSEHTWDRASGSWFYRDSKPGTFTVFYNYDIGSWLFGFRFEREPEWFDMHVSIGPIDISLCYWRRLAHLEGVRDA